MVITPIKGRGDLDRALNAYQLVFQSSDPFNEPFLSTIFPRAILFPSNYSLQGEQFEAMTRAATLLDDEVAFFSTIETFDEAGNFDSQLHAIMELTNTTFDDLLTVLNPPPVENVFYSSRGRWGVITSHEEFALLGGRREFIESIDAELGLRNHTAAFIEHCIDIHERWGARITWVPTVLQHVYGDETASQLLRDHGFPENYQDNRYDNTR